MKMNSMITGVEDTLLGAVLTGVPELPGLGLLLRALLLAEHQHHHTLSTQCIK